MLELAVTATTLGSVGHPRGMSTASYLPLHLIHLVLSEEFSHVLPLMTHSSVWTDYFTEAISTPCLSWYIQMISKPLLLPKK